MKAEQGWIILHLESGATDGVYFQKALAKEVLELYRTTRLGTFALLKWEDGPEDRLARAPNFIAVVIPPKDFDPREMPICKYEPFWWESNQED
jgi:hypothetical protein